MYWYNFLQHKVELCCGLLCIVVLASCRPNVREGSAAKRYFDLKTFINADSARLNKLPLTVVKTVRHNNDVAQTKELQIKNWGQELAPFSASDINKPAWKDSYSIINKADSVVYAALEDDLVTRRMVIYRAGEKVKRIKINNYTKNLLYQTVEQLDYYPDSLYSIDKLQKVRFLGSNRYTITGKIKQALK
ncbi:hypothetical protein [Mucilaginibacter aquatilis]|uniref:Uncharacterized protein n=1 Tax=Mucilaginibacter aquatilis TaxID=1517760 RepID=A0A6I4I3Z6_9SPHI|nr:hypothetical protein [Mucilaginibacter aquatilis]MVN89822.1 hypothetical protein [Mucilaginibacter aquatilis]